MKKVFAITSLAALLAGCALLPQGDATRPAPEALTADGQMRPQSRPATLDTAARRPPVGARTVEDFDTTTAEERQAAVVDAAAPAQADLGATIASLGDPAKPGFWLETPLVSAPAKGRVTYGGKSVQVDLIPIDGPKTAGSRMSLAAMRLLGAPLTGLPEVRVRLGG